MLEAIVILSIALAVGTAVAVKFWPEVLEWSRDNLIPWLEQKSEKLGKLARSALAQLDQVAVPLRVKARRAWEKLRKWLLQEMIELRRESNGTWVKTITTYFITVLDSGAAPPMRRQTEEVVSWDDLPLEVRDASLRWDDSKKSINVTEIRDKELRELVYEIQS